MSMDVSYTGNPGMTTRMMMPGGGMFGWANGDMMGGQYSSSKDDQQGLDFGMASGQGLDLGMASGQGLDLGMASGQGLGLGMIVDEGDEDGEEYLDEDDAMEGDKGDTS